MDDALPVEVALADQALAADVIAHVESVLGWQAVAPGPHLPVRLRLADHVDPDVPTVRIAWAVDGVALRAALREGAVDALSWPADADRLAALVPAASSSRPARHIVAVTAVAGGVGASTVALALGAHHAWAGRITVVATDEAGLALAGHGAAGAGGGTPLLGRLHVVAGVHRAPQRAATAAGGAPWCPDVMVIDRGVGCRGQIIVGRPDRALLRSLPDQSPHAVVVTLGEGGLRPAELRRALDGRHHIALPLSFRVARAGLRGRVPLGLPGSYLAAVADAVPTTSAVAA